MNARQRTDTSHERFQANYSHHLLDDSKLDEESIRNSPPMDNGAKASLERPSGGVMKILRNPGIKCQHQVSPTQIII
jgi:hypothetical protein